MKIAGIQGFPVESNLIAKIDTDEGLCGIGEAEMASQIPATLKALEYYSEWKMGRNPCDIVLLWQSMFRHTRLKEEIIVISANIRSGSTSDGSILLSFDCVLRGLDTLPFPFRLFDSSAREFKPRVGSPKKSNTDGRAPTRKGFIRQYGQLRLSGDLSNTWHHFS